ncbi:MFS transporter [Nonomuraea sp. NPDC046802]|uniref:MFS transporter n=1 Tax=Nonomuraea sp. NPDC046802 TaxID=3154919 RepID=UPI0033EA4377
MTFPSPPSATSAVAARTHRKVFWRLIPLLALCYFIGYIDRANISFARAGLTESFGMSAAAFGFAAGIFFLGYALFEVPSNLALNKYGARKWITRIMISWGIMTVAIGFVTGPTGLYIFRFLLGVAEAGFFPGIILYLSLWFPNAIRARMTGIFMLSIPIASAFGSIINGQILQWFDGTLGLEGWRWMFLLGGIAAVILGFVVYFVLIDSPDKARWLDAEEREWLVTTLAAERAERAERAPSGAWAIFRDKRVLLLALIYFLIQFGGYPLIFWMPSIIADLGSGLSSMQLGLVAAIPYSLAGIVVFAMARRFSRRDDQVAHIVVPLVVAVLAFAVTMAVLGHPLVAFAAITIATMASMPATPMFWSLPTFYLNGLAAASGIALINSVGSIAGFLSPYAFGWIKDLSGSDTISIGVLVPVNLAAALVLIGFRIHHRRRAVSAAEGSGRIASPAD